MILSGVIGILNSWGKYDVEMHSKMNLADELLNDIDIMISKAYEKGMYS
ncbi:hypothetical protein BC6_00012 [Bacillus phage BC-6]|nr:hypothetical protein BC6_00012 [Bacillus phage BC-6]